MITSLKPIEIASYVANQVNHIFNDASILETNVLIKYVDSALIRSELCFSKINNKYFYDGQNAIFNHLNGDQYSMFLYFLSNSIYKENQSSSNLNMASKIYLLNKALHGIDVFYEIELPEIFIFVHPVGTVLGRADYSNNLVVYQRCGIGANKDNSPQLGKHLTLHPGSSILGSSVVGDNCSIASDSILIDTNLGDNTLYLGNPSSSKLKEKNNLNPIWCFD